MLASTLAGLAVAAIIIRSLFLEPFHLTSASMEPTLAKGELVLVSKGRYGYGRRFFPWDILTFIGRTSATRPQSGEVVAFRTRTGIVFIKRVVGIPGDTVQIVAGRLLVNGASVPALPESADFHSCPQPVCAYYRETLPNGACYVTLDLVLQGPADDTVAVTVPPGFYYVLGDNRDNSVDSRYEQIGFIHEDDLIGPVIVALGNRESVLLGQGTPHAVDPDCR